MKVYITKWALTRGILIAESEDISNKMIKVKTARGYSLYFFLEEWHKDLSAAKAKTMDMISAKEKSLNKQIAKLTKFVVIVPLMVEENLKRL